MLHQVKRRKLLVNQTALDFMVVIPVMNALSAMLTLTECSILAQVCHQLRPKCINVFVPRVLWRLSSIGLLDPAVQALVRRAEFSPFSPVPDHIAELRNFSWSSALTFQLPLGLTSLTFADAFDEKICPGLLPPTLTHLAFGNKFRQSFGPGVLPQSLVTLELGIDFMRRFPELGFLFFPLKKTRKRRMKMQDKRDIAGAVTWNCRLDGVLPSKLVCLRVHHIPDVFQRNVLPVSLRELTCHAYHSAQMSFIRPAFPPKLTQLRFLSNSMVMIKYLPRSLVHLTLEGDPGQLTIGDLPSSLTFLQFGKSYNFPITQGVLPASLTELVFGPRYSQPLTHNILPRGLKRLVYPQSQQLGSTVIPWAWKKLLGTKLFYS